MTPSRLHPRCQRTPLSVLETSLTQSQQPCSPTHTATTRAHTHTQSTDRTPGSGSSLGWPPRASSAATPSSCLSTLKQCCTKSARTAVDCRLCYTQTPSGGGSVGPIHTAGAGQPHTTQGPPLGAPAPRTATAGPGRCAGSRTAFRQSYCLPTIVLPDHSSLSRAQAAADKQPQWRSAAPVRRPLPN